MLLAATPKPLHLPQKKHHAMYTLLKISTLIILTIPNFIFGQSTDQEFLRIIDKKQAVADIDSLTKWVDEIHPNMFKHVTKSNFNNDVALAKARLTKSLSVREFYNIVCPLLSVIKDAHTEFHAPFIVKEERNDLFPFQIKLTSDYKKLIVETAVDSLFLL